jgi:hypothetical protein
MDRPILDNPGVSTRQDEVVSPLATVDLAIDLRCVVLNASPHNAVEVPTAELGLT